MIYDRLNTMIIKKWKLTNWGNLCNTYTMWYIIRELIRQVNNPWRRHSMETLSTLPSIWCKLDTWGLKFPITLLNSWLRLITTTHQLLVLCGGIADTGPAPLDVFPFYDVILTADGHTALSHRGSAMYMHLPKTSIGYFMEIPGSPMAATRQMGKQVEGWEVVNLETITC